MSFSRLHGLGVVTFTMDNTSVHGSDGWSYDVKAAFQRELATELAHPPYADAHTIVGMMIGITDNDYRANHGTPGNQLSDFGAFANSGSFQAHFNPLSDAWFAEQVGGAAGPVITSFSATPAVINKGQISYLDWSVSGPVTRISIDHSIGTVQNNSRHGVMPNSTESYMLTAQGPGGWSSRVVVVTVLPPVSGGDGTGSGGACVGHGESGGPGATCCAGQNKWTYDTTTGQAFAGIQCWIAPCATDGQWAGPAGIGNNCCAPLVNVNGKCGPSLAGGGVGLGGSSWMLLAGAVLIAVMMMKH